MDTTLFLAQFWGWLMVILGLLFFFRKPSVLASLFRLAEDKVFVATSGYLSLILGLVTLILHNVWVKDWEVLITIFGWAALLKGMARISLPNSVHKMALSLEGKPVFTRGLLLIVID